MKLESHRQILGENSNIKFNQNPSSGSRVPYGRTDEETDMTRLIVTFLNFANALRSECAKSETNRKNVECLKVRARRDFP